MDTTNFDDFLNVISKEPLRVIDSTIACQKYVALDLSSTNSTLSNIDVSSSKALELYLEKYLKEHNAEVAYGGYLEQRDIYSRSSYFKQENTDNERNIHLGVDLWCHENTKVLAVLEGKIHSFQNNINHGDYGPTIILKHSIQDIELYSLYGHLSLNSIANLKLGQHVQQGEVIGNLGDSTINGDYAPHLHFQLIRDMENYVGDYPGVSSEYRLDFYRRNCPDPNVLLKLT